MKPRTLTSLTASVVLAGTAFGGLAPAAMAAPPDSRIAICHATASTTNPYVRITVAQSSVDGDLGNDKGQGDHYAEHRGPIGPVDDRWGDIIPPIPGVHGGLNWDADGRATYFNGCTPTKGTVDETPPTVPDPGDGTYVPPDY